jgi:hypothetical protein
MRSVRRRSQIRRVNAALWNCALWQWSSTVGSVADQFRAAPLGIERLFAPARGGKPLDERVRLCPQIRRLRRRENRRQVQIAVLAVKRDLLWGQPELLLVGEHRYNTFSGGM